MLREVGRHLVTDLERLSASEGGTRDGAGEERSGRDAHPSEAPEEASLELSTRGTGDGGRTESPYAGPA
jgi:hypothetical protein